MFSVWSVPVVVLPSIFIIAALPRSEKSGPAIEPCGIGIITAFWVMGVRLCLGVERSLGNPALILHLTLLSGHTVRARPFSELWKWKK